MRTFLDLFCGCGGFSLGLERAGLRCLAAIDVSPEAVVTFRTNLPRVPVGLDRDLTRFGPEKLSALLGGVGHVDLIVGGPPCQGFSNVRQVDSANHGPRVRRDKRRYLFRVFLDYVQHFQPKIFVMENVLGLQSAAKGKFFTAVQAEARALGYRVHPQVEEAWRLGVPQKRRRQLIVGVRQDVPGHFPTTLRPAPRALPDGIAIKTRATGNGGPVPVVPVRGGRSRPRRRAVLPHVVGRHWGPASVGGGHRRTAHRI